MHGRENRKRIRHMFVPSPTAGVAAVGDSNGLASSFVKDVRKISVGDCALFKPPQESPPFIGIIRKLGPDKENLQLVVNWFYRPADIELVKGVAVEAAPNEVFYSFHSDEIPAASLLHPCKVAFLRKGVELPSGVSSFVCRRVYDTKSKRLWWLTDKNYMNDQQEEVNNLLRKTELEMHATVQQQQGGRSPKPLNSPMSTSQQKHSPDSMQNSSSTFSTQVKGKKRERSDQLSEPAKRERSTKSDDGDSSFLKPESMRTEIARITDQGGLVDSEGVERLVQIMQPDKSERKVDLNCRSLLAGVIAATEKDDCLNRFVQLRGLPVLDEWLQEVHKGKIGDPGNIKDGDKSVEDFLLVLLRALDKLPVNLNALKMCNIGKSVNHLRWHKNSEIQKKARSLVDTWKKRVEAEISINDAKSVSSQAVPWTGKSRHDGSHGGNRHSNGSSDAAIRSSVTHHSSLKSASVKLVQGDSALKSASAYQGVARSALSPTSAAANLKDGQSKISASVVCPELTQAVVKEERSSSSSQSHTNSQCSSDHAKNIVSSVKEDAKSSTAASRRLNKLTGSASKHRKSANGLHGTGTSGLQREAAPSGGTSAAKISAAEKVSQSANATDVHEGNNHKLIVKIPNRGRGPAQSIAAGSVDDFSCGSSRASSPALSEKHDQLDASLRGKHDTHPSNEVDGSSTSVQQGSTGDAREMPNVTKAAYLPSRNEIKSRKAHDSSFSSMNALVESCVKFSQSNASMSAGDDAGMNLLASVAAGEISVSGIASPATSGCRDPAAAENSCGSYNENKNQMHGDESMQPQSRSYNAHDTDKQNTADISKVNDVESNNHYEHENVHQNEEICLKSGVESDERVGVASSISTSRKSIGDGCTGIVSGKCSAIKDDGHNDLPVAIQSSCWPGKDRVNDESLAEESEKKTVGDPVFQSSSDVDDEKNKVTQQHQSSISMDQSSLVMASKSEATDASEKPAVVSSGKPSFTGQGSAADDSNEVKLEKTNGVNVGERAGLEANIRLDHENNPSPISQKEEESGFCPTYQDQEHNCMNKNVDDKEAHVHQSSHVIIQGTPCEVASLKAKVDLSPKESNLTAVEDETKGDSASATALSPAAGDSGIAAKVGFDLNEGLGVDDGKNGEPAQSGAGPCMDTVCSISPMQIPVCSSSSGLSAAITVASAAKGPFVPPDDLLRNKSELGWKGSAATSAFRPAEPRKVTEVLVSSHKSPLPDAPPCKRARMPLDIDLNVADETSFFDIAGHGSGEELNSKNNPVHGLITTASLRSSVGLELDLNKVDEAADVGHSGQRVEVPTPPIKASTRRAYVNGATSGRRDFDLNTGPATEEMHADQTLYSQQPRGNIVFQPPFAPRMNGSVTGNCFAWYPPGTGYSVSMTPSSLPEKDAFPVAGIGSAAHRVMGGPTSSVSFNHDDYKGSVLSSTPAMPFQSTTFQYPVFPFGTNRLPTSGLSGGPPGYMDPAAGGRISAIPSQSVGTTGAVSFQYPQPYVVSRPIPDVANNGIVEATQKWRKQGLDLNSGPGGVDMEGRDESQPTASRQLSAISPQTLAEEQARMYNMVGGVLKRNEPEGGWSMDKINLRPSSWR